MKISIFKIVCYILIFTISHSNMLAYASPIKDALRPIATGTIVSQIEEHTFAYSKALEAQSHEEANYTLKTSLPRKTFLLRLLGALIIIMPLLYYYGSIITTYLSEKVRGKILAIAADPFSIKDVAYLKVVAWIVVIYSILKIFRVSPLQVIIDRFTNQAEKYDLKIDGKQQEACVWSVGAFWSINRSTDILLRGLAFSLALRFNTPAWWIGAITSSIFVGGAIRFLTMKLMYFTTKNPTFERISKHCWMPLVGGLVPFRIMGAPAKILGRWFILDPLSTRLKSLLDKSHGILKKNNYDPVINLVETPTKSPDQTKTSSSGNIESFVGPGGSIYITDKTCDVMFREFCWFSLGEFLRDSYYLFKVYIKDNLVLLEIFDNQGNLLGSRDITDKEIVLGSALSEAVKKGRHRIQIDSPYVAAEHALISVVDDSDIATIRIIDNSEGGTHIASDIDFMPKVFAAISKKPSPKKVIRVVASKRKQIKFKPRPKTSSSGTSTFKEEYLLGLREITKRLLSKSQLLRNDFTTTQKIILNENSPTAINIGDLSVIAKSIKSAA